MTLSLADVVDRTLPSVALLFAETDRGGFGGTPVSATGSGAIMRQDGYILTNRHLVEDARTVDVTLHDRRTFRATNIWQDNLVDLAVVKIEASDLPALEFGDPVTIRPGDTVIALGHALALEGGASVTAGVVSNLGRSFTLEGLRFYDVVQTDAAINPGNSGGPLVNLAGELVGINTAGLARAQGIGYAINAGLARHVFDDLVNLGKPEHSFLGVNAADISQARARHAGLSQVSGAVVVSVENGSPAQSAGMQTDDVILALGDNEVTSVADLIRWLWRYNAGDTVQVKLLRDGVERVIPVALTERAGGSAV